MLSKQLSIAGTQSDVHPDILEACEAIRIHDIEQKQSAKSFAERGVMLRALLVSRMEAHKLDATTERSAKGVYRAELVLPDPTVKVTFKADDDDA